MQAVHKRCERCKELVAMLQRSGPGAYKFYENVCEKCQNDLRRARGYAMSLISKAKKKGEIERPDDCELCYKIPGKMSDGRHQIIAHHAYGYEHPLEIWWICHDCNQQLKGYEFHCSRYTREQVRAILGLTTDKL